MLIVISVTKKMIISIMVLALHQIDMIFMRTARTPDDSKFLKIPKNINFFTYLSTNYARKFAIDFNQVMVFDQYKE
jgi:hypothetical protein